MQFSILRAAQCYWKSSSSEDDCSDGLRANSKPTELKLNGLTLLQGESEKVLLERMGCFKALKAVESSHSYWLFMETTRCVSCCPVRFLSRTPAVVRVMITARSQPAGEESSVLESAQPGSDRSTDHQSQMLNKKFNAAARNRTRLGLTDQKQVSSTSCVKDTCFSMP